MHSSGLFQAVVMTSASPLRIHWLFTNTADGHAYICHLSQSEKYYHTDPSCAARLAPSREKWSCRRTHLTRIRRGRTKWRNFIVKLRFVIGVAEGQNFMQRVNHSLYWKVTLMQNWGPRRRRPSVCWLRCSFSIIASFWIWIELVIH